MTSPMLQPLPLPRGRTLPNRFAVAPMTNLQSHDDGTLSDDEYRYLTYRAEGGFGLTMTCAAHVQAIGQGFPGQLGVWGDHQLPGLIRLAAGINATGSVSIAQLHHAGNRSPAELIGAAPVCPSDDDETGARALTTNEVLELVADFIAAAVRCEKAGFDGVELHGAHTYIINQFLSAEVNQRDDQYGGSLQNRSRMLFEMLAGIRARCGDDFIVGVRLSPERSGMKMAEIKELTQQLIDSGDVDFMDISLWDSFKEPDEDEWKGRSLVEIVCDLERREDPHGRRVPVGVAGKIYDPADVDRVLDAGADFALLGKMALIHHDFPQRVENDPDFTPMHPPVTRQHLLDERLSEPFVEYMQRWPDFVAD